MILTAWGTDAEVAPRWRRADAAWERLQEQANARLAEGKASEAARLFRRAGWVAALAFRQGDPRRATTLANLGLADRLAGREGRAERRYAQARAVWAGVDAYIAGMRIVQRSRSARLERAMQERHLETFRQNMRIRMRGFARDTANALAALEKGAPVNVRLATRWATEKPPVHDDTRRFLAAALLLAVPPGR